MESSLISIVIPIYNAEHRLEKCLDSLLEQTYENIEIILVDDGSSDNSLSICQEYADNDSRIRIFSSDGQGVSAARNMGIDNSSGQFLMFVDSDDFVTKTFCYDAITNQHKYHSDLVLFGFVKVEGQSTEHVNFYTGNDRILRKEEALTKIMINSFPWNKLYRRSLFRNIRYPEGKLYEDTFTTYKLFNAATNISFLNKENYYYVYSNNSTSAHYSQENIKFQFQSSLEIMKFLKENYPDAYLLSMSDFLKVVIRYVTYCDDNYDMKLTETADHFLFSERVPENWDRTHRVVMKLYKASPFLTKKILRLKRIVRKNKE